MYSRFGQHEGNKGEISREDIYTLLSHAIVKSPTEEDREELTRDIVEILLKKMDLSTPKTQTPKINKADFAASVKGDHLLLEVFGRCMPTLEQSKAFITKKMLGIIREEFSK